MRIYSSFPLASEPFTNNGVGTNLRHRVNKKDAPFARGACDGEKPAYLLPRIASLAAFATRNFTTRLALI